jgi:hypothetical protein
MPHVADIMGTPIDNDQIVIPYCLMSAAQKNVAQ